MESTELMVEMEEMAQTEAMVVQEVMEYRLTVEALVETLEEEEVLVLVVGLHLMDQLGLEEVEEVEEPVITVQMLKMDTVLLVLVEVQGD